MGTEAVKGRYDAGETYLIISVFKAPLMNLRQLENKVFKNSTGLKKHGRIFFKMFSYVVFPQLPESSLLFSLT